MSDIYIQGESLHVDNKVNRVKIEGINETFESLNPKILRVGEGGGASALIDLTDVDISTPTSGQILKYDEENDKWVNGEEKERVLSYEEDLALTEAEKMNGDTYYINNMDFSPVIAPVIYSTDEREVGVWIDGKPLYQKTIVGVSFRTSVNAWADTGLAFSNIDQVITCIGGQTDTSIFNLGFAKVDNGTLRIWTVANVDYEFNKITLQYTKTTDTSGSGIWTPSGIPAVHYSTSEQVIGTWIDGKPLYQKTWVFSDVINLPTNTWVNTPIKCSDYNFERVVNAHIMISSTGTTYNYMAVAVDDEYVRVNAARPTTFQFDIITIQYTKTTD